MSAYAHDEFGSRPFDEMEEMALAAELLEVNDEAGLDQFLGKLLKKAGSAIAQGLSGPLGSSLGGYLKGALRKALPTIGSTIGNYFVPGVGGKIGGQLASQAGKYFSLELEGLSAEDGEYEVARRFVRFAGAVVNEAARDPGHVHENVDDAARRAVLAAARLHAPGFIRARGGSHRGKGSCGSHHCHCSACRERQRGKWVRHGRQIHLVV